MTVSSLRTGRPATTVKPARQAIPEEFVAEVIDGIPFYYRGFRQAIKNRQNAEQIMADSYLQSMLKNLIGHFLRSKLDRKTWQVLAGELGSHIDLGNNLGLDVTVFDRVAAYAQKDWLKFSETPPRLVIEIDVNVELPDAASDLFQEYVVRKINRLFEFGTPQVVWVFTKSKKVLSATPGRPWQFFDLKDDVLLMGKVKMNLAKLMAEEGISPDFY